MRRPGLTELGSNFRYANCLLIAQTTFLTLVDVQNAAGNGSAPFGPASGTQTMWNPDHYLDTAEMLNAFAYAYDWLYDIWTPAQKESILWTMITYGMQPGLIGYNNSNGQFWAWWTANTEGNWNCVCNGGLTAAALAILGDDTTGTAEALLNLTIPNAIQNCVQAVSNDGTWSETPDYWYFGSTGFVEMAAALLTAAGSEFGLLTTNPAWESTPLFHMANSGPGSLFGWGDNGPNKYTSTANALLFLGDYYNRPEYILYQRDQFDARDPFAVFYYDPRVSGAFWDGLALDHFFTNSTDQWASMRSSWTDENAMFAAMKFGTLVGHQTHNDLDCGDFVIDALGTRWLGEYGDADYNAPGYFSTDAQNSERWLYYRKRTEAQNTILVDGDNQLVTAAPTIIGNGSTGEAQGSSTVYTVPDGSTAFFTGDMSSAYGNE